MTEEEKMIRGMIYDSSDKVLEMKRTNAHKLSKDYNDTYEDEVEKREEILKGLLPIWERAQPFRDRYNLIME